MRQLLILMVTISQLCQGSYLQGQCNQWCKDFDADLYSGGVWMLKESKCRCFTDFSRSDMDVMKLPFKIRKENSGDGATL